MKNSSNNDQKHTVYYLKWLKWHFCYEKKKKTNMKRVGLHVEFFFVVATNITLCCWNCCMRHFASHFSLFIQIHWKCFSFSFCKFFGFLFWLSFLGEFEKKEEEKNVVYDRECVSYKINLRKYFFSSAFGFACRFAKCYILYHILSNRVISQRWYRWKWSDSLFDMSEYWIIKEWQVQREKTHAHNIYKSIKYRIGV